MKKSLMWISCLMILAAMLTVSAVAAEEVEDNDDFDSANPVELAQWTTGQITHNDDKDYYKVTVDEDGYFQILLRHDVIDSTNNLWQVALYDETFTWIAEVYSSGKAKEVDVAKQGVPAGTYYVVVRSGWTSTYNKYYNTSPYQVCVNFTASDNWEKEFNENWNQATPIDKNNAYNGTIRHAEDYDYYQFLVEEDGFVQIILSHEVLTDTSDLWKIELYDEEYNWISRVTSTGKMKDADMAMQGLDAGIYYVKVSAAWTSTYNKYWNCTPYNFTVTYQKNNNWEKELNENWSSATPIETNAVYSGSIRNNDDYDYYRVDIEKDGVIQISFSHEVYDDTRNLWKIALYDEDYNWISEIYSTGKSAQVHMAKHGLSAGSYYIRVAAAWTSTYNQYWNSIRYNISVSYQAAHDWEKELNPTWDAANLLPIGSAINGTIGQVDDVDVYEINMVHSGNLQMKFAHDPVEGTEKYWKVQVYNSAYDEIHSVVVKASDGAVSWNSEVLTPGVYYVTIRAAWTSTYNKFCNGTPYSITMKTSGTTHTSGDWITVSEPTCTTSGVRQKQCTACGEVLAEEKAPATGHTTANWSIDREPSCNVTGQRHGICDVCGTELNENIDKLPHEYGAWSYSKEPTCHESGNRSHACTVCGQTENETVPPLEHKYGDWVVTVETSCRASGRREHTCSLCGETESESIPRLEHTFGDWVVVSGNKLIPPIVKEKTCSVCAHVESEKDWSNIWITVLVLIAILGILIGVINYFRAFRKK